MNNPVEEADRVARDPERLSILHQLNLLDTPAEEAFDRLTRLASKITGSPISVVSLIDADRQFFKSLFGLPEMSVPVRQVPLSHSFCKHVVATGQPLIVEDARTVDFLKDNLAISELNVIGYLGMPLTTSDGTELGSFCVIDTKPHQWTERDIEIVRELAVSVMTEIELRVQVEARKKTEEYLVERQRQYQRVYHFAKFTLSNMKDIIQRGSDPKEILVYVEDMERQLARL